MKFVWKGGILLRKHYLLIISALIISVLITLLVRDNIIKKEQEKAANGIFVGCLSDASACFGIDYTKSSEESKNSYYIRITASLHTAIYILPYTSYSKNNQKLETALSGIYQIMVLLSKPDNLDRWKAVTVKRQAIFECLSNISLYPSDKNNYNTLIKIANDITN